MVKLGLKPAPLPERLTSRHRLIIGRLALEKPEDIQKLIDAGFDNAITNGMRAVIFEQRSSQWEGKLMGLRMKRVATRRAFIRASGHPVFKGLIDSDFKFLRGDSNLIEAYPGIDSEPATKSYPVHYWHWGNDNIVSTYTLEKPQQGTVRALLDCGFDLVETPLLEVARGKGLLIFCQVDVTNRIGNDPVSTRLTKNILHYLMERKLDPPASISLSKLLEQHPPRAWIEGYFSTAPDLPGIHTGDLFFREKLRVPAFDANSDAPLFAQIEMEGRRMRGRKYWVTSLSDADLKTNWQKAKLARINAALRFLNGERSDEGPTLKDFTDTSKLYPYNWNRLPKMDDDFDPYVYYRW